MSVTLRSSAAVTHGAGSLESARLRSDATPADPPRADPTRAGEAARQQAIVAALFAPDRAMARAAAEGAHVRGPTRMLESGLSAYRGNGIAIAERALQAVYPATCRLLGESAASAAAHLWRSDPPRSGDLADWGAVFADWLAAQPSLADWPQLAGCARIEWARHCAERVTDTTTDIDSLGLLGMHPAESLRLRLKPDVAVVLGAPGFYETWRDAAQGVDGPAPSGPPASGPHSSSPATSGGGSCAAVAIWRDGFAPRTEPLTPDVAIWLQTLSAGGSLSDLIEALSGADLETTLANLITRGWLLDILTTTDIAFTEEST